MPTRPVTGHIHAPDDTPLEGFGLTFTVDPSAYTGMAHYPTGAVSATTDEFGAYTVTLNTGIRYVVRFEEGTQFTVTVPPGEGATTLEEIRGA